MDQRGVHGCLTRVITDADSMIEIAQRQWLLQRIQAQTAAIPAAQREYIAHALLELAVSRLSEYQKAEGLKPLR